MQLIIASDGNVSFVILLYNNMDQFNRLISFDFSKEDKHQDFQLRSENKHIFRIDG